VLGEIPGQDAALGSCDASCGRPDGSSSASSSATPHGGERGALARRAAAAGLRVERRVGPPFGFFAVLGRRP
jgi:hypothetical protein